MKSKFVAIEGLDGVGKSTQIKLLIDFLKTEEIETRYVHFPRSNEGVFGELISKFLRGEFGDVKNVHPQLVALLFAEDRKAFSDTISQWMDDGFFVLVDRYVLSNIAFQCAKTVNEIEKNELKEWIYKLEYEYNKIPKPDLSIYLDMPVSFIYKSLNEKRNGHERKYLNGKDDIHEKDIELQIAVQNEYEKLTKIEKSFNKIVCYNSDEEIKSINEIHFQILSMISSLIPSKIQSLKAM